MVAVWVAGVVSVAVGDAVGVVVGVEGARRLR
jgi:hypothetical protein